MTNDFVSSENLDDFLEIREESSDIITESDIKIWSRCRYAYFLKRHVGLPHIPQTAQAAESVMFRQARKGLLNIRSDTGRLFFKDTRVGPQFKTLNELTAEELPKYIAFGSPESFGNAIFARWLNIEDRFAGKDISWNFKNQKFSIANELKGACRNYYRFILENGTPLPGYINKDLSADVKGAMIRITFPELRIGPSGPIIDDPTIWSFNAENLYDDASKIEDSALITLRILGFSQLASQYGAYARIWGVSEEDAEEMRKEIIGSKIRYRHFNASKNRLSETSRKKEDLDTLNRIVENFIESDNKGSYAPNMRFCQGCGYNVLDMTGKIVCSKAKDGIRTNVPGRYFKKKNISVDVSEHGQQTAITVSIGEMENKSRIILGEYTLNREKESDPQINITSSYKGNVRGLGYEEMAIERMDRYLEEMTESSGKQIMHSIDFTCFKYAGQKSISELFMKLGYFNLEKRYSPGGK